MHYRSINNRLAVSRLENRVLFLGCEDGSIRVHKLEGVNEEEEAIESVPNWNMNDFWTLSVHDGEQQSTVRSLFPLETSGGHLVLGIIIPFSWDYRVLIYFSWPRLAMTAESSSSISDKTSTKCIPRSRKDISTVSLQSDPKRTLREDLPRICLERLGLTLHSHRASRMKRYIISIYGLIVAFGTSFV